jgi:uncharacterized protein YndB with AHSA1/START domain
MNDYGIITAPRTMRMERLLPGPIERVWEYLTDSEKRRTWLAGGPIDLRPGGALEFTFRHEELSSEKEPPPGYKQCDHHVLRGEVIRCEKPRLLILSWGRPPVSQSEVMFELTQEGQKVRLVLTHRLLPNRQELVGVSAGWHVHLDVLEDQLAGVPPRSFWTTHTKLEAEYQGRIAQDA